MKTIKHAAFLNILLKDKDFFNLFKYIQTFSDVIRRLDNAAEDTFAKFGYKDRYEFVGDLFEIFAEMFLLLMLLIIVSV